ncbi:uncharacterized protein B0P05DRAFT_532748, partial [Gilbertella persicaria]|uniref:uncharacterized protein n=1 Tax=Gilbertella persicaria TaxID=101096 RepID=UPI00221E5DB1
MFDFIDSEKYFSRNIEPYQLIKGEFDVCKPYFYSKQDRAEKEGPQTKKRKKNKISKEPSETEIETEKRHKELRDTLLKCLQELLNSWPIHLKEKKVPCISNTEN